MFFLYEVINNSIDSVKEMNNFNEGDVVVITAGAPVGKQGTTNLIKVQSL